MQNLATVAAQVGVLFALMAVGAVCRRVRLVDEASVTSVGQEVDTYDFSGSTFNHEWED